jgi:exodeoxyribonuclease VII large subunit
MTEKLSLTELQQMIRDSLYISLPDMYWVVAEISEINVNYAGHCYLELIEKQPDDKNIKARIKAIIWCKKYNFLKSYFVNISGETLREGLKILIKTKIEYHELYGLSLIICDIDPSFTLGDMALKRGQIIKRLEQEGVFTMNRELPLPLIIRKIAIISSASAAGYTDFMNQLKNNGFGYVFHTRLFESPMQGSETEQGIISALDKIAVHSDLFDIVVIIRGGGSQVDLSWFDNYNIAYYITQFPLPVITGIGHDKDLSVTDMVACVALKTPTAVADLIVNHVAEAEEKMLLLWSEIRDLSRKILDKNRNRIESAETRLFPLSKIMISGMKEKLSENSLKLMKFGKDYTSKASHITADQLSRLGSGINAFLRKKDLLIGSFLVNIKNDSAKLIALKNTKILILEKTIEIIRPENIMKRGYTITSLNGRIVRKKENINFGDIIETRFSDGSVLSRVIEDNQEVKNG